MMTTGDNDTFKSYMFFQAFDIAQAQIPKIANYIRLNYLEKLEKNVSKTIGNIDPSINEIVLEKYYKKPEITVADAILSYISLLPDVKSLVYSDPEYFVNYFDKITLPTGHQDKELYFQLVNMEATSEGELAYIKFRIYSHKLQIDQIRAFIGECYQNYLTKKQNKLGNNYYYFDQYTLSKSNAFRNPLPEDKVFFTKNLFTTNRTLNNVYFEQRKEVLHRVNFFLKNKEWYDQKGIPYTLGFLFHGTPGTGKTSTIKAIANMTGRHIINLNMGHIKTKTQLKKLFYDDGIHIIEGVNNGSKLEHYKIPVNKRLYVIEDIDCADSKFVLKRKNLKQEEKEEEEKRFKEAKEKEEQEQTPMMSVFDKMSKAYSHTEGDKNNTANNDNNNSNNVLPSAPNDMTGMMMGTMMGAMLNPSSNPMLSRKPITDDKKAKAKGDDEITLSCLLNILDGTLETPGRMVIITSNYPEKLDNALIRPGRIDMCVEFKKANQKVVAEMYKGFYDLEPPEDVIQEIEDYKWTPAEINQILFKNFDKPVDALYELINEDPRVKYAYMYPSDEENEENQENSSNQQEREQKIESQSDSSCISSPSSISSYEKI